MLQPFERFTLQQLEGLEKLNKRYLVSQSYHRAAPEEGKATILLTDYDLLGAANIHLNAVKGDKYAAVLDLRNEKHKSKLIEMLNGDSSYRLFWSVVKSRNELKRKIDKLYNDKIKLFIDRKTNWRIGSDSTIRPDIEVTFGELFIVLKYGRYQEIRVKFEDIEKM